METGCMRPVPACPLVDGAPANVARSASPLASTYTRARTVRTPPFIATRAAVRVAPSRSTPTTCAPYRGSAPASSSISVAITRKRCPSTGVTARTKPSKGMCPTAPPMAISRSTISWAIP